MKQVEHKLHGRDIDGTRWENKGKEFWLSSRSIVYVLQFYWSHSLIILFRSLKISEQVDHLLKQATSIDNLCNMYEGWTPWIWSINATLSSMCRCPGTSWIFCRSPVLSNLFCSSVWFLKCKVSLQVSMDVEAKNCVHLSTVCLVTSKWTGSV